jgi:hypothetical protein
VGVAPHAQFTSKFVSFDYSNGVVTDLRVETNFVCGNSTDEAEVLASDYGAQSIHANRAGRWQMSSDVLDEYGRIVKLDMTGRVSSRTASGRMQISEPNGLNGFDGAACHAHHPWTAARPTPPAPPGPQAFFSWDAIRASFGASYRYYFAISGLSCSHGATDVQISIDGRQTTVSCHNSEAWASGPLAPGRQYRATATAIRVIGGRTVNKGAPVTETLTMPGTGDHWQPISNIPGTPPA